MTTYGCTIDRDVVRVSGPDASTFLQGQLSQDVDALAVATSTWTFVLQPQGKVHTWARVTKTAADVFLLDTDPGAGAPLVERLSRYLIRTRAEVDAVDLPAVSVRGVDAPRLELPDSVLRLPIVGPGVEGYDLLGEGASIPAGVEHDDGTRLEVDRVLHGVPVWGRELDEDVIPAEVGQWIIDASVNFAKGCFVGQELVARIDSRGGNVPRQLRAIVLDAPVAAGTEVTAEGPAGPVTSVVETEHLGPVALAYCGRRVEPGVNVIVGETQGVVHELPLADPAGA